MDSSTSSYRETEHEQTLYDTTPIENQTNDETLEQEINAQTKSDIGSDIHRDLIDSNDITGTEQSNHESSEQDINCQTKSDSQNNKDNEISDSNEILDLSCSKKRKVNSPMNAEKEIGLNDTHEEDETIDVVNDIESAVENQTKVDENISYEVVDSEDRSDTSEDSDIESSPVFSHRQKETTVTMRKIKQEKISI